MVRPMAQLDVSDSREEPGARARNLRTALMLGGTMIALFVFAVTYICLFH